MSNKKSKPSSAPRVWTNEEEITLLRAMVDYKDQNGGVDPVSKFAAFYEEKLNGLFQNVFSCEQVRSKMKNLRRRFVNARERCKDGADPVYSKPHDCLVYDLSKTIWADYSAPANGAAKVKVNGNAKTTKVDDFFMVDDEEDEEPGSFRAKYKFVSKFVDDVCGDFPSLGLSAEVVIGCFSLIGSEEQAREWDEQARKLHMEEMELRNKMRAFLKKHSKVG